MDWGALRRAAISMKGDSKYDKLIKNYLIKLIYIKKKKKNIIFKIVNRDRNSDRVQGEIQAGGADQGPQARGGARRRLQYVDVGEERAAGSPQEEDAEGYLVVSAYVHPTMKSAVSSLTEEEMDRVGEALSILFRLR